MAWCQGLSHQAALWVLVVVLRVLLAISIQSTGRQTNLSPLSQSLPVGLKNVEQEIFVALACGLTWKRVTILPTASIPYVGTSHPSEWTVWECTLVLGEALVLSRTVLAATSGTLTPTDSLLLCRLCLLLPLLSLVLFLAGQC